MARTNLIVNGKFDAGNSGWSGHDLETNYRESAYLGNGSSNRVAELDGRSGNITVMEQTFRVEDPTATEVTIDAALRTASLRHAGQEGFVVSVLDEGGSEIAHMEIAPTTNAFSSFALPVSFPTEGNYTLRMTEFGPDNSLGAIIDNVELMVCFLGTTLVNAEKGRIEVGHMRKGDFVETNKGLRQVIWVARRRVKPLDIIANPKLRPIRIQAGALGCGLPINDVVVSRQHRIKVSSQICERMFGVSDVLVSAGNLLGLQGVYEDAELKNFSYVHLFLDQHYLINVEGIEAETLLLGTEASRAIKKEVLNELIEDLSKEGLVISKCPVLFIPSPKRQRKLIERHKKNSVSCVRGQMSAARSG